MNFAMRGDLCRFRKVVADLHSKILDARPHLSPIFLIFVQFLANFGQMVGWRPPFWLGVPSGKSWICHWSFQVCQRIQRDEETYASFPFHQVSYCAQLNFWRSKLRIILRSLLPPASEVCEGNVFTGVCLSTGGGSLSRGGLYPGGSLDRDETPGQRPQRTLTSGRYASYWNVCLLLIKIQINQIRITVYIEIHFHLFLDKVR